MLEPSRLLRKPKGQPLEPQFLVLVPPLTGDLAVRTPESGCPSFKCQPCCLRTRELGQVSSPLCALIASLKWGALCEENME